MNNQYLFDRSFGYSRHDVLKTTETSRLVYALQPNDAIFEHASEPKRPVAHASGVNTIVIDKFEGRYLLSGGADSSIAIWDLESRLDSEDTYKPLISADRTSDEHKLGITQLSFYPFDSLAFLSSSYDHTLKLFSSETLEASASFNLDSVVYTHALSPIASHLLVACGTQHPAVRLVDLRSGASTHSLAGHSGAILSVAWSPVCEHILASGATDGSVRFWDIRRGSAELGVLDMEDSFGTMPQRSKTRGGFPNSKAHSGPVNGIVWTEDGRHLITTSHDERIRVWNTDTGANTLVNFGPTVRNTHLAPLVPILAPTALLPLEKDILFYPNEREILMYELFEGKMLRRMRRLNQPGVVTSNATHAMGQRNTLDRVTALAWRAHDVELYSAHSDGSITAWTPRTEEDARLDDEEEEREEEETGHKRKRGVLEDIYQELTKRKITFGGLGL
ncbi:WD40 repeat-like protein [Delitschia confertaspora ATCC 74209]|uniref:WD40 repeat-like protein n=1 Tax=Delitschia confertaspora ATCC 74209 TaxID=1513339 RepID=A0A9P4JIL7_9PLEO|nr:WD40 repeat-like protein [Delitschia confertaspora ATCC 74209]